MQRQAMDFKGVISGTVGLGFTCTHLNSGLCNWEEPDVLRGSDCSAFADEKIS
jgi:hypothetical protein